jgi:hypothetical protein
VESSITKNLWLLLTVVIPGLFTYGLWRILLFLAPTNHPENIIFSQIDSSALATTSVIFALALIQQSFAISFESLCTFVSVRKKKSFDDAKKEKGKEKLFFFIERLEQLALNKINESTKAVIGNFFLSLNMLIGLILLMIYFIQYEGLKFGHWIPVGLSLLMAATITTALFRYYVARMCVQECKKREPEDKDKTTKEVKWIKIASE